MTFSREDAEALARAAQQGKTSFDVTDDQQVLVTFRRLGVESSFVFAPAEADAIGEALLSTAERARHRRGTLSLEQSRELMAQLVQFGTEEIKP